MTRSILFFLCIWPIGAGAMSLELPAPGSRVAVAEDRLASLQLPITPWAHGGVQSLWAEGAVSHEAWRLDSAEMTTLELLAPLRRQVTSEGYDVLFECEAKGCGGFDFRYELEVLPEPDMHVDLGDYRYLVASRAGPRQPEYICLIVSRAAGIGFVQITRVGDAAPVRAASVSTRNPARDAIPAEAPVPGGLIDQLLASGGAVLGDLTFETGSARLGEATFASLAELARYLKAHPDAEIVLVGHTDAEGSLAGNIALSKARATAVRQRLARRHGIAASRMEAEGVGFLSPIATNQTSDGRTRNRRVEVVLSNVN